MWNMALQMQKFPHITFSSNVTAESHFLETCTNTANHYNPEMKIVTKYL